MGGFATYDKGGGVPGTTVYADNVDFTGTGRTNTITTDGQLLIGATTANAGGNHINVGSLVAGTGITIGYSSPNITITSTASATDLHVAKLIVNPASNAGGNFTTIASALASAVSGDTIFIMPATYTENLTLKSGVNLTAFDCDSGGSINFGTDTPHVKIIGKMTATFAGTATLSGIFFQTNSDFVLVVSGTLATMVCFKGCFFNGANNSVFSGTSSGAGAVINLLECWGNLATTGINYFALTSGCGMNMWYTYLFNSGASTTANTVANASALQVFYSAIINPTTTSNTASFGSVWSEFFGANATALTIGGTGSCFLYHSRIESGSASAISIGVGATLPILTSSIDSTNTNAITGAGTIKYSSLVFTNTSSAINTTTQTILNSGPSETFGSSNSGNTNTLTITNTSNTASSQALQQVTVAGGTAGDAFTTYTVSGTTNWSQGLDNSDSDAYVLAASTALGTTNVIRASTSGQINYPLQPTFSASLATTVSNVTGDNTNYSVVFDTEQFDVGNNFSSTTFTAPVTGKYLFNVNLCLSVDTTTATAELLTLVTTGKTFNIWVSASSPLDLPTATSGNRSGSQIVSMTAADTAIVKIQVNGNTKTSDVNGENSSCGTFFNGILIA